MYWNFVTIWVQKVWSNHANSLQLCVRASLYYLQLKSLTVWIMWMNDYYFIPKNISSQTHKIILQSRAKWTLYNLLLRLKHTKIFWFNVKAHTLCNQVSNEIGDTYWLYWSKMNIFDTLIPSTCGRFWPMSKKCTFAHQLSDYFNCYYNII